MSFSINVKCPGYVSVHKKNLQVLLNKTQINVIFKTQIFLIDLLNKTQINVIFKTQIFLIDLLNKT